MIEATVDDKAAKAITRGKLPILMPAGIIGITGGLFYYYSSVRTPLDFGLLTIVLPVTLIIVTLAVFVGLKMATKKITGSKYELTSEELIATNNGVRTSINLNEIRASKEGRFALMVKGSKKTIWIPKPIDKYESFKAELIKRGS